MRTHNYFIDFSRRSSIELELRFSKTFVYFILFFYISQIIKYRVSCSCVNSQAGLFNDLLYFQTGVVYSEIFYFIYSSKDNCYHILSFCQRRILLNVGNSFLGSALSPLKIGCQVYTVVVQSPKYCCTRLMLTHRLRWVTTRAQHRTP